MAANMYQNPLLNAPLGPDGLPIRVDPREAQEHYEVSLPAKGFTLAVVRVLVQSGLRGFGAGFLQQSLQSCPAR